MAKKLDGKVEEWNEKGQLIKDIDYKEWRLNGMLRTYWDNGKSRRVDKYEDDKFISGKCFTREGKDTTYFVYEKMPQFPGGQKELFQYIAKETIYPRKLKKEGIEGCVVVRFFINTNGSISNISILKSSSDLLSEEAIRVVKSLPNWEPALEEGIPIRTAYTVPISYKL
jgi:periplasmic protein TonB